MSKRSVSHLDVPLFTDLPTASSSTREEAAAQRSVAFGRCPHHSSHQLTGIVRGGRHLYWRAHYVRTYGSARLCTASDAPLCTAPVDRHGPPCPCGSTPRHSIPSGNNSEHH
jgi:hypothetical protein